MIDIKDLIITTDNAGKIGEKMKDEVNVSYDVLSYYTLRNAIFENLSKGGVPKYIVYNNFCGDKALSKLLEGMKKVLKEIDVDIEMIGSTESNFIMNESAFSVSVIGVLEKNEVKSFSNYAIVGKPLVGNEFIDKIDQTISINEFKYLLYHNDVSKVIPIGSKGINDRAREILNLQFESASVDLLKSAGPSSCVLIEYDSLEDFDGDVVDKIVRLTNIKRVQ